jgi:hypothetical protein
MLANQGARIALLKTTSAAKKRNTDLAFLIGGNDAAMDEETRAWYDAHRQEILRPRRLLRPPLRRCPLRRPTMHRRPRRRKAPPTSLL